MPADEGAELLLYAVDKEEEALLFQRWVAVGQTECSFDEFKAMLKPVKLKADKEVLEDVEQIMTSWEANKNGNI